MEPSNGSVVNGTSIVLRWALDNHTGEGMNFTIVLGESQNALSNRTTTSDLTARLDGLKAGSRYYWKVVPVGEGGDYCEESVVWSFTVAVPDGGGGNGTDTSSTDYLPVVLGIAFVLLVPVLFFVMRRRRKRYDASSDIESLERENRIEAVLEADIIHVPEPGKDRMLGDPEYEPQPDMSTAISSPGYGGEMPVGAADPTATFMTLLEAIDILRKRAELNTAFGDMESRSPGGKADDGGPSPDVFIPEVEDLKERPGTGEVLALPPPDIIDVTDEQRKLAVDELFLITHSGLLIQHYSLQRETGFNEDVLASMMMAVKSFMSDSLSMLDKDTDEESDVNRIDFGKNSLLMVTGKTLIIVGITEHEDKDKVLHDLRVGLDILEERFGSLIEEWDGDTSKVEAIRPHVEALVKGEL